MGEHRIATKSRSSNAEPWRQRKRTIPYTDQKNLFRLIKVQRWRLLNSFRFTRYTKAEEFVSGSGKIY